MIKLLTLKNFQSHRHSELEFSEGLNVIIGASDSGKSAIIRALKWLIWNRPGGEEFRSFWGGDTEVGLTIDENVSIGRFKSNSENTYGMMAQVFKAFGTNVPEEIKKALDMEDINFQGQFDSSYLLSETAGNIASHFNKIAGLDKIDIGLSNIQRKIKNCESDIRYNLEEIKRQEEVLKLYEGLPELEKRLKTLETLEKTKSAIIVKKSTILSLIDRLEEIDTFIARKKVIIHFEEKVDYLLNRRIERSEVSESYQSIKKLALKIYYIQEGIKKKQELIKLESRVNTLINLQDKRQKSSVSKVQLLKLYESINQVKINQENLRNRVNGLEEKFKKEMPDICPLCNSKIK